MTLQELISEMEPEIKPEIKPVRRSDAPITGISLDSRTVCSGELFAALSGSNRVGAHTGMSANIPNIHGIQFVEEAIRRGACAVLHDGERGEIGHRYPEVAELIHLEPRRALAGLSAAFYRHPARSMRLIAVTGTNGKTTVAAMMESILTVAGERVGVIGTTGVRYSGFHRSCGLTTPDAVALQRILRDMADAGCTVAVMEVSSHALDQHRVAGLRFDVAVFTNLSRDHLDYHGNEERYFQAKAALFTESHATSGVVCLEDIWGRRLWEKRPSLWTCGFSGSTEVDFSVDFSVNKDSIALSWEKSCFSISMKNEKFETDETDETDIILPASGVFNVLNGLMAAAASCCFGVTIETVKRGLELFKPVAGRMEQIVCGQPFSVVVDYAHTPESLKSVLMAARRLTAGRVMVVFGCGGERDREKRGLMGEIAGQWADVVVVTDDNPRREDPHAIRSAILKACRSCQRHEIADRKEAIIWALSSASTGDVVMIVGKGHEQTQVTADGDRWFDDAEVARRWLCR